MNDNEQPYKRIGCSYYDQLEAFAVKRSHCSVLYTEHGAQRSAEGVIVDVFSNDTAEYLKLDNGTVIRLDHLISVNGIHLTYAC